VSRRTPGENDLTRISIEAASSGPFSDTPQEERQRQYAKFGHTSPSFTAAEFLSVVDKVCSCERSLSTWLTVTQATKLMGINDSSQPQYTKGTYHTDDEAKHFSSDILRVEISGPNRSHFSILDLPGVFQSVTKNLTAKEKDGVRHLVAAHMIQRQSVIV